VAVGIALDVIYSRDAGLLSPAEAERILKLLERLGFRIFTDALLNMDDAGRPVVLAGLEEFREHLGGELSVTLLKDIGHSVETHRMEPEKILGAIAELRARAGK
jgi:3-dehydroquinate synthase